MINRQLGGNFKSLLFEKNDLKIAPEGHNGECSEKRCFSHIHFCSCLTHFNVKQKLVTSSIVLYNPHNIFITFQSPQHTISSLSSCHEHKEKKQTMIKEKENLMKSEVCKTQKGFKNRKTENEREKSFLSNKQRKKETTMKRK